MMWQLINNKNLDTLENVLLLDQADGVCIGFYFEEANCFIRDLDGKKLMHVSHYCIIPQVPGENLSKLQYL